MPPGALIPPPSAQVLAPPKRSIPLEWGVGLGVVALVVMLYLVTIIQNLGRRNDEISRKANPRASEDNGVFRSAEMVARAPRGKIVYDSLPLIPGVDPNPLVLRQPGSTLALMVTEKTWNRLSKTQQIDLTWYIQSLIPQVRGNPEAFLRDYKARVPIIYKEHVELNRSLCSDCWEIFIGEIGADGAATSLTGRPIVKGDSVWKMPSPSDLVVKASEFRKTDGTKESAK